MVVFNAQMKLGGQVVERRVEEAVKGWHFSPLAMEQALPRGQGWHPLRVRHLQIHIWQILISKYP